MSGVVYWFLVVEACFLLAAVPGFLGVLFLERNPSNIPLYALCLVPVAPAFSAAISTIAARNDELSVWPTYADGAQRIFPELLTEVPQVAGSG